MSALLLPQSSMAWCQERPLSQTTSPKGESESVEVSVQLPQPCETLPRRPTCFSPDPDFQGNLQSGGAGRGWKHSSQGSELIKETLLTTSWFFLPTISWSPPGILPRSHWGASSMDPQLTHCHPQHSKCLTHALHPLCPSMASKSKPLQTANEEVQKAGPALRDGEKAHKHEQSRAPS